MNVVVDTNVFAAAFFENNEWCQKILELESKGAIKFLFTDSTATELFCVFHELLNKKGADKSLTYRAVGKIVKIVLDSARIIGKTKSNLCFDDPNDNKFIDCAIDGRAECLVSNNGLHLSHALESGITEQYGITVKIKSAYQFYAEFSINNKYGKRRA